MIVKRIRCAVSILILGSALLVASGCATQEQLETELRSYATKSDLDSLRSELLQEIQKAQGSAQAAQQDAAASAAAARQAAEDARKASEKADAIFQKSLRK